MLLLFSALTLIFYKDKNRNKRHLYFYWEISYLMLVSILLFPHQMKYAMLYFVPAGSYVILFMLLIIEKKVSKMQKSTTILALSLMLSVAMMGRDLLGNYIIDIFDYYHTMGITTILFLPIIAILKPDILVRINRKVELDNVIC